MKGVKIGEEMKGVERGEEMKGVESREMKGVESGEEIQITVAGRLAAKMVPATPRRWQTWAAIADLFDGRPDPVWNRDRDLIDQSISNPWERRDEGTA